MVDIGDKIADLNIKVGTVVGICPVCGNKLVVKTGKYGKFVGCNGFKTIGCRKTYKYETFRLFNDAVIAALNIKARKFNELSEEEKHKNRVIEQNRRKREFEKARPMGNWWF